jgi:hypothetical protein
MHTSHTGSSEFLAISNTRYFEPSGGKGWQFDMVLWEHQLNCLMLQCEKVEQENQYLSCMGKRVGPAPVIQKHGHKFNLALLNW